MAYGLLGAHLNATIHGVPELVADWRPPLVVVLDHGDAWHSVKAASPKTVFVGRNYLASEPDFNNPGLDPIQAARDNCAHILPWAEKMGMTYSYWQGVNEPILNSADAMRRFAGFETERARIMNGHGFRIVVGSFSVGNPAKMAHWKHFLPALEAANQFKGALALHEYAWPTLDRESPWYLLRHRKVYEGEPEHQWKGLPQHLRTLPLFITECGLDGLIELGHPPRGFRTLHGGNPEHYLRELAWYNAELKKDKYVRGAAIYCCGGGGPAWSSYDIWPEPVGALARQATPIYRKRRPKPPKPAEPPQPTPTPEPEPIENEKTAKRPRFRGARFPAIPLVSRGTESLRTRLARLAPEPRETQSRESVPPPAGEAALAIEGEAMLLPEMSEPAKTPAPAPPPDTPSSLNEAAKLEKLLQRLDKIIELLEQ